MGQTHAQPTGLISFKFHEETLKEGVPTKKARDETVNVLATLIMVYTARLSPKDISIIHEKIIQRHPVLKDHVHKFS